MPYEKFADGTKKDLSEEIPFDLPQGWAWARIGEVCSGFQYGTARKSTKFGTVPVLRMGNLQNGEIDYSDLVFTSNKDDIEQYSLRAGDLLFNRTNSSEKVGKVSIFRSTEPCIFAGYLVRFRPTYCDSDFVNYVMNSRYQWEFCQSVKSDAVNQSNISASKFIQFLIPLPPLAEQKRIVAKVEELFAYANQIGSASEEITKTAQRLDKKILDLAIRGKLVQQDPNDEPASELVKRIEAVRNEKTGSKKSRTAASHKPTYEIEPPFDIPESWQWVRLGDVVQFMSGNTPSKDALVSEGIPYFKVAEMNLPGNECVLKHTSLYVSKAATIKKFPQGTIVFPKNGGAMLTNKKRILGQESVCDLNTGGLKSYIEDMTDYLFLWFASIDLGKYVKGGVIPTTDVDKLRTTPIPLPPLAEQKRIVKKIDELKEMTQALVAL